MPSYENLFEMLGDIQSFVQRTGAPIHLADNLRGWTIGFSAGGDQQGTRIWYISLVDIEEAKAKNPEHQEWIQDAFATAEARIKLARALSQGGPLF